MINRDEIVKIVAPAKETASDYTSALSEIEVTDQATADVFSEIAREMHAQMKTLEAERTKITKPLLDAKRAVDALFKPAIVACTDVRDTAKRAIMGWLQRQEEAEVKALDAGDFTKAALIERPNVESTAIRVQTSWAWRVTDFEKIPRKYLTVDNSAVKILLGETPNPEALEVPGIEFYQDSTPVMRR